MLSRDKQVPATFGINRNNTVSLTYDIQNTSTKLILLNFSKKEDNRIRGYETAKENVACKSARACHCLSDTSPACACHHRDKDLCTGRHDQCYNGPIRLANGRKSHSPRKPKTSNIDKLPPCTTSSKEHGQSKKERKQPIFVKNRREYNRDLEILYSMPSLSHPDFTQGQRRVLLSLARIYTHITPIHRIKSEYLGREYSVRSQSTHSKGNREKRSNGTAKKKNNTNKGRRGSLQTAVKTFSNENDKYEDECGNNGVLVQEEDNHENESDIAGSDSELDAIVDYWVQNIIEDQTVLLTQEYKNKEDQVNAQGGDIDLIYTVDQHTKEGDSDGVVVKETENNGVSEVRNDCDMDHNKMEENLEETDDSCMKDNSLKRLPLENENVAHNEEISSLEHEMKSDDIASDERKTSKDLSEIITEENDLNREEVMCEQEKDEISVDGETDEHVKEYGNDDIVDIVAEESVIGSRLVEEGSVADEVGEVADSEVITADHKADDANENMNLLRHISDELREMIIKKE